MHTLDTEAEEAQVPAIVHSSSSRHKVHLARMKRLVNLGYLVFLG